MDDSQRVGSDTPGIHARRRRSVWAWLAISALFVAIGLAITADLMLRRAGPILKGRLIETLRVRFNSQVDLDTFHVAVSHGLNVSGGGLRIYPPDDVRAAGDNTPLIAVSDFSFHAGLRGLFIRPTHIGTVHVTGLTLTVPPRELRRPGTGHAERGKIKVTVEFIQIDDSRIVLQTLKPNKDPKVFAIRHVELRDFGPQRPMQYNAILTNAIPPGEIHAAGVFGPWNVESPGDSAIQGNYTFANADLNSIRGISGTLHSTGRFTGKLNRIEVWGSSDTPDFALDTANRPTPLHTDFHAIVDGTDGDTLLMPVQARLAHSSFTCRGAVVNIHGKGHIISLSVDVPDGRIEDFLALAVKSRPFMTGRISMQAKLNIPPGPESVARKLQLQSQFTMRMVHFTDPNTEDRVNQLSQRAQGNPDEAHPGAPDVHSTMAGDFVLRSGQMDFTRLVYAMPGGEVRLAGTYSIVPERFEFTGDVRTHAKLSQMVSTWWKSWLLKPVDPFFHKNGDGAVIPIRVSGTKNQPHFSLDFNHKH